MTETTAQTSYRGSFHEAGSPCYRCQATKPAAEQAPVRIRVAVFFDGTLNNRTNTGLGEKGVNRGVSYENALTNIAILERYYQANTEYDYSFSVYVEGIGTEDEEADSGITAGTDWGSTGIKGKVEKGISRVIAGINKQISEAQRIECLHLDCFGFSRGAAAARNFIYAALLAKKNTLKLRLHSSGYTVNETKIKFVGLYDTVASHGFNHSNDTNSLHLDAIKHAADVVQLAAAEEHRLNFPLTNISSAPHGLQLFLPGAHSDVGGGYVDNDNEVDHLVMFILRRGFLSAADKAALIRERDWLVAAGWYLEDEIQEDELWNSVKVTRRGISNSYHHIPLHIMAELASEKRINFLPSLGEDYAIPPDLQEINALIRESPLNSPEYWLELRTDKIKELRHNYLHFSACFGSTLGCNDPRFTDNDPVSGHRKRKVIDG